MNLADPHSTNPQAGDPTERKYLLALSLGALGVVYGDIGTSPLYALRECFFGPHGIEPTRANVLGVLSLIFWALILVISVKYLVFVMRADNRGEGGILALMSLLRPIGSPGAGRSRSLLIALGLFGAALLYGDGIITPAISVLSAIEGLEIAVPGIAGWVVPITIFVIVGLFMLQRHGTAEVGRIFGPLMLTWFLVIAALGLYRLVSAPGVLAAVLPHHAVGFFLRNGFHGFVVLGSVVLVVTGGEALYADMGHFGKKPIKYAWFMMVLPALLLNYFGQGALMLTNPLAAAEHTFFRMAPGWMLVPLVILATLAASVASQAVISGAFSITRQAVQLGYSPRLAIQHTSAREIGQIYVSSINWSLMFATILLVLSFRSASNLAAAYGIAVTSTMVITTVLFATLAHERWRWPLWAVVAFQALFLTIDLAFFGANAVKVVQGGWVPIVIAGAIYITMTTWKQGRAVLAERLSQRTLPTDLFLADMSRHPDRRVPGTAVFMTGSAQGVPPALVHNLKHNKVIHEQVILLTVVTKEVPHVPAAERVELTPLQSGFYRVIAFYGFMEEPRMSEIMNAIRAKGILVQPLATTFFLGRDTIIVTDRPGLSTWRKRLFAVLQRNALSATAFFGIPYNQVVELGAQIEL